MALSGIDISTFKPGSTRGASASMASRQGATPIQIMRQGDWTNLGTYQRFYNREVHDTPVGQMILQSSICKLYFYI